MWDHLSRRSDRLESLSHRLESPSHTRQVANRVAGGVTTLVLRLAVSLPGAAADAMGVKAAVDQVVRSAAGPPAVLDVHHTLAVGNVLAGGVPCWCCRPG